MEENVIQINGGINDKCRCEHNYIWNPSACSCGNGKYIASIMDDSAITFDKIIESYNEETKTIPTNFNERKQSVRRKIYIF